MKIVEVARKEFDIRGFRVICNGGTQIYGMENAPVYRSGEDLISMILDAKRYVENLQDAINDMQTLLDTGGH